MAGLLTEVYEQPAALHHTLDALATDVRQVERHAVQLQQGKLRRVIFTGMGSSYWAAFPCMIALHERDITAFALESSEFMYYHRALLDEQTLVVAISQSGRSVEVVKLLDAISPQTPVIGITNDPQSPLAQRSTTRLLFKAGEELTVSTKTYTCTLAALHLLAAALTGGSTQTAIDEVRQVADAMERSLPAWNTRALGIVERIQPVAFVIFVGRGPSRASCMTSALITKETAKIPTEGMVSGQFRHGPMEVVAPGITTVIFAGPGQTRDLNLSLARDLTGREGSVVVVGADVPKALTVEVPAASEMLTPVAEIVPVQLIAAQLAARRGLEVGTFRFGQKITTTE